MRRHSLIKLGLIIAGLLLFPLAARAGGWALVTLDSLPAEPRAGQTLHVGFMVRQHGVTPIDSAFGTEPVTPRLTATNAESGESISVDARKDGPVGHFVVDVTFPSAGSWEWQIAPEPFQPTKLGKLSVLPAVAASPQPATAVETVVAPATSRIILRWIGAIMLLVAAGLALAGRRGTLGQRRPSAT